MALSQETKHKIVFFLGYPGKVLIEESTHFNKIVSNRMDNLNTFIEDQVEVLLEKISETRNNLESTQKKGNVKSIGDIHLDTTRTRSMVQKEYKRCLEELSCLLDIPIVCKGMGANIHVCGP